MVLVFVAMFAIISAAGLIALYVAFPHRGREIPHSRWLGNALERGVERLPTLDNTRERQDH